MVGGGCQIMMVRKRQPLIVFVSIEIIYQMSEPAIAFNCLIKLRVKSFKMQRGS